jgi:transposase
MARAKRGQRAVGVVPRNYGQNTTLIAALTPAGIRAPLVLEGALDQAAFETYVAQCLVPVLVPGQVVVWDNLSVHKSVRALAMIEAAGCQVCFLPAYSPDYNPIELAFSKLKTRVRQANQRSRDGLWTAIGEALGQITHQDARHWFRHCGYQLGHRSL